VLAFLTLALTGMMSQNAEVVRAAYLVMGVTTWGVIVPLALLGLVTGIVSSLFTKWGLFRYYWVLMKLIITVLATLGLLLHSTGLINRLVEVATRTGIFGMDLFGDRQEMVILSAAALVVLLVLTVLSVYKPRGLTPYGQRKQDEQRKEFPTEFAKDLVKVLNNELI
jgi:hypothetical protein